MDDKQESPLPIAANRSITRFAFGVGMEQIVQWVEEHVQRTVEGDSVLDDVGRGLFAIPDEALSLADDEDIHIAIILQLPGAAGAID